MKLGDSNTFHLDCTFSYGKCRMQLESVERHRDAADSDLLTYMLHEINHQRIVVCLNAHVRQMSGYHKSTDVQSVCN